MRRFPEHIKKQLLEIKWWDWSEEKISSSALQNTLVIFLYSTGFKSMKELTVSLDILDALVKIREELDEIIETLEITNDEETMEGIKRGIEDIEKGRIHELKDIDELLK